MEEVEMMNVADMKLKFENLQRRHGKRKVNEKESVGMRVLKWLTQSRFGGIPMACCFGLFIYYYVTYLMLSSKEVIMDTKGSSFNNRSFNLDNPCNPHHVNNSMKNNSEGEENVIQLQLPSHLIGSSIGISVAFYLGSTSIFSKHTRCGMLLVVPGLLTGRGRALMLTAAMGILLEGPVRSINHNMEQIVNSLSCMYTEMKGMVCNFQHQFKTVLDQLQVVLEEVHDIMQRQKEEVAKLADKLVGKALTDAKRQHAEILEKMESVRKQLHDLNIMNAPGDIINAICTGVSSVFSIIKDEFDDVGREFAYLLRNVRRKKRDSGCGIPRIIPEIDINVPGLDLEQLRKWAAKLMPDMNVLDLNFDEFKSVIQSQSIYDLRKKILDVLKDVFALIKDYSDYMKKLFYIISLILICRNAFSYLTRYCSDNSFDNMYVDNNLRNMWNKEGCDKLTPLRKWELSEKYQVSVSMKLSRRELKRIIVQAVPTLIFTVVSISAMISDYALASFLSLLLKNGQFGISFAGMEQGIDLGAIFGEVEDKKRSLASLKLEGFDLTTEPCMPRPMYTSTSQLGMLVAIFVLSFISCLFDAYASRWRAQICNLYYVSRAKERGEYLYKKIKAGRGNRRFQLKLIILEELNRRRSRLNFSWWTRAMDRCRKIKVATSVKEKCPACNWTMSKRDAVAIKLRNAGREIETAICFDCHKDF